MSSSCDWTFIFEMSNFLDLTIICSAVLYVIARINIILPLNREINLSRIKIFY